MKHYLIAWANCAHESRLGSGNTPQEAANDAYGVTEAYSLKRMTFIEVSLSVARSTAKLAYAQFILYTAHQPRITSETDSEQAQAYARATFAAEINRLERYYSPEWQRYTARYGEAKFNQGIGKPFHLTFPPKAPV